VTEAGFKSITFSVDEEKIFSIYEITVAMVEKRNSFFRKKKIMIQERKAKKDKIARKNR
jgi:hypothetical protein